jgi:parallel beta-helix repeat protein
MVGVGITVSHANNVTVRNLVVKTFPVGIEPNRNVGTEIPTGKGVEIINNAIGDCNTAIMFWYEANNLVSGNVIKDNEMSGIHIRLSHNNTIYGNIIMNSTKGMHFEDASQNTVSNNVIAENQ